MEEFLTLEDELKQDESNASLKSETEDAPEETPNGVKPWVSHLLAWLAKNGLLHAGPLLACNLYFKALKV